MDKTRCTAADRQRVKVPRSRPLPLPNVSELHAGRRSGQPGSRSHLHTVQVTKTQPQSPSFRLPFEQEAL